MDVIKSQCYCENQDRPQFSIVYILIDRRNDVKIFKTYGSWFHLSFEHFDVIAMVDKSIDLEKLSSIY